MNCESEQESLLPLNILILYDLKSTHVNTTREYLDSFFSFSSNNIFYAPATTTGGCYEIDVSLFDVVVIHYSVRLSLDWHISPFYAEALKHFNGLKVLFIQDEYENTETARNWINDLGINVVYTCVPQDYVEVVYPPSKLPNVDFITTLTGWVPSRLEQVKDVKPVAERKWAIGYRGRPLNYRYGNLGQEKLIIGKVMRQICEARGVKVNIEWEESHRIYGDQWYEFLGNCRATLATESGANVFDDYGDIRKQVDWELTINPFVSYQVVWEKYLKEHEGKVQMNQISPKAFEAIALRTALILFEGKYSNILQPDIHYIPLKKDFSNVDDVLAKLQNDSYLEELTERAYQDIVASGRYNYRQFIKNFDEQVRKRVTVRSPISPLMLYEAYTCAPCQQELIDLRTTVVAMKSSKFWKLRDQWFETKAKVKQLLGLRDSVD